MPENERMTQPADDELEIDLGLLFVDMLRGIRKFWPICAAIVLVLASVTYIVGACLYRPAYVCETTFTVQTGRTTSDNDVSSYEFYYSSSTASRMVNAFIDILQSDILRQTVADRLGMDELLSKIEVTSVSDSNVFTLRVEDTLAQRAYDVTRLLMENYSRFTDYAIGDTQLYVLTQPVLPEEPENRLAALKAALIAGLLGLLVDFGWILVYALMRSTIRTREEVRTRLNQNCLAMIPQVRFLRGHNQEKMTVHFKNRKTGAAFQESMRGLRTALLKQMPPEAKVLLVTSTAPGEGKTTVATNLASMLGMMNRRVLLIDADLRVQSVLPALKMKGAPRRGFGDVLAGTVDIHDVIEQSDRFQISIVAGTRAVADPAKLLRSGVLAKLTQELRREYDYIIFDSPPCGMISDAALLAGVADAALLVVRQDMVRVSAILSGIENLAASGVPLLGCVLNGTAGGARGYGAYGHGYGHYGYGHYGYGHYGRYGEQGGQ